LARPFNPPQAASLPQELDLGCACGATDIGLFRENNQDNFLVAPERNLMMVADGMGGHAAGEVASAAALEAVRQFMDALPVEAGESDAAMAALEHALAFANQRLYAENCARGQADGSGMGTTLTGAWQAVPGGPLLAFHVGDSRLYRYRRGELVQLTRDQSLYQQALDSGQSGPLPPRNLLLQALGPAPEVVPELRAHLTAPGDLYLLCSDGLHGATADDVIAAILDGATRDGLPACCARLIGQAKRDGGRDNITVLLLQCRD
jgi:protein phosphatase